MNKVITVNKKIISVHSKFPSDIISGNLRFDTGLDGLDFVLNQLTARLSADVLESQNQDQKIYYYAGKPTFWDWFHGREKKIVFNINVSDLMINPPVLENTSRMYKLSIDSVEDTNK